MTTKFSDIVRSADAILKLDEETAEEPFYYKSGIPEAFRKRECDRMLSVTGKRLVLFMSDEKRIVQFRQVPISRLVMQ